jgi:hypothetical protein
MIGIATLIFDVQGDIVFHNYKRQQGLRSLSRRLSRTATMDAEVQIEDNGLAQGDRNLNIVIESPTKAQADRLQYLIENYSDLRISTAEGVFLGVISTFRETAGKLYISIMIKERLTAFSG